MKTPLKRALYSALILPGLGQWNNQQKIKGLLFMGAAIFVVGGLLWQFAGFFSEYFKAIGQLANPEFIEPPTQALKNVLLKMLTAMAFWTALAVVIWTASGLDAYYTARRMTDGEREEPSDAKHSKTGTTLQ